MKMPFLVLGAILVAIVPAQASVFGTWSAPIDAGSGLDRYLLIVDCTEPIKGFDIAIENSQDLFVNNGSVFHAAQDQNTGFLFQTAHYVAGTGVVGDLAVYAPWVGASLLQAAFSATGNGIYASGWTSPLNLAEIVVLHGSVADPYSAFSVHLTTDPNAPPMTLLMDNSEIRGPAPLEWPEPGTLVLLLTGGIGLAAYALRRRLRGA